MDYAALYKPIIWDINKSIKKLFDFNEEVELPIYYPFYDGRVNIDELIKLIENELDCYAEDSLAPITYESEDNFFYKVRNNLISQIYQKFCGYDRYCRDIKIEYDYERKAIKFYKIECTQEEIDKINEHEELRRHKYRKD